MSLLSKVTSGVVKRPKYVLMHGIPGIGKSTFASEAPKPIFLCAEKGTDQLDVNRLELQTLADFRKAMAELATTNHDFQTLVIDTVDHLEPMIFKQVCADKGKNSIEDIGFSKGYVYALDYWGQLISDWESLRDSKNMNVILLAHTQVKMFNDPQLAEGYDRYEVKLHAKAAGLLVDRVDSVLFVNHKTYLHAKDGERNKALGDGSRVVYTEGRPAFMAKNRYNMPLEIPLSWADYVDACEKQQVKSPEDLLKNITSMLAEVKDAEMKKKIAAHVEKVKASAAELSKVENRLKTIVSAA